MRRRIASVILALSMMAGTVAVAPPAEALSADCALNLQQILVSGGLDYFRAGVFCTQIGADTKVRARLARSGGPDYYSVWLISTNTWRYTGWYTCYLGCWADMDMAPR